MSFRLITAVHCVSIGLLPACAQPESDAQAEMPASSSTEARVDFGGNGYWRLPNVNSNFESHVVGMDARELFLPWTRAMYEYHQANDSAYDPEGFCLPPGGPRSMGTPFPAEIIQQPDRVVIIFEGGAHVWREIFTDGRELPPIEELTPTYFGYSVGSYEDGGSTLVVQTRGFNEKSWINAQGYMHTDQLQTTERFSRPAYDTLHYEAVIDDPGAYTAPWTVAWDIPWEEGVDPQEYVCQGDNQFLIDLTDDLGNPFFSDIDF